MKRYRYFAVILSFIICLSSFFYTHNLKANFIIMSKPPAKIQTKLFSLGEACLLHKIYSLKIQNFGDNYGRYTPLNNYDYNLLYKWMKLEDYLDPKSDIIPAVASYYYSKTQNVIDNNYLIAYLVENFYINPPKKWWWLYQAINICNYKIKNQNLALHLSHILSSVKGDLPIWTKQLPAFIFESLGEKDMALIIMKNLLYDNSILSIEERNFINYYINQRIKILLD